MKQPAFEWQMLLPLVMRLNRSMISCSVNSERKEEEKEEKKKKKSEKSNKGPLTFALELV